MYRHWDSPTGTTNYRDLDGYVYFIQTKTDGRRIPLNSIKIGFTRFPFKRIPDLCKYSSDIVLAVMKGNMQDDELRLHVEFKADHISDEWFKPSPELMEYIAGVQNEDEVLKTLALLLQHDTNESEKSA